MVFVIDNFAGFETTGLEERGGTMNFVFTGRCTYRGDGWTRAAMQRLVTQAGHTVQGCISGQTHYLVASRTDTRKAHDAEVLGVAVITYDMFMTMMQNAIQSVPDREHAGPLHRINFEIPSRPEGRMGILDPSPSPTLDDLVTNRGYIFRRPNLSESPIINPCSEVHIGDGRVTSKNRPVVRTVAHGGRIRRNLDL